MTCIVGIEMDMGIWIGGDSAAVAGTVNMPVREPKVFVNGDYLIGFTSSFRMGQLLRFADLPKSLDRQGDELLRFMCTEFVDAVRQLFKDGGFAKRESDKEEGGTFLVGVNGALLCVEANYMIGRNASRYEACGAGRDFALGALHATPRLAPERRIRKALEASAYHSIYVAAPFTILKQEAR